MFQWPSHPCISIVLFSVLQLCLQDAAAKIDLRQCVTDELVPVSLGSSTEANAMELTVAWSVHDSSNKRMSTTRLGSAHLHSIG